MLVFRLWPKSQTAFLGDIMIITTIVDAFKLSPIWMSGRMCVHALMAVVVAFVLVSRSCLAFCFVALFGGRMYR